jgi:hypothetical protein
MAYGMYCIVNLLMLAKYFWAYRASVVVSSLGSHSDVDQWNLDGLDILMM